MADEKPYGGGYFIETSDGVTWTSGNEPGPFKSVVFEQTENGLVSMGVEEFSNGEDPMTHDEAIKKLEALEFTWSEQAGHTITKTSDRCLTYQPGCCHGWIEISGGSGLIGAVELKVDGGDEFALRFPSLVDLVQHITAGK